MEPDQAVEAVKPPPGMSDERFAKRYQAYKKLLADSPIQQHGSGHQRDSLLKSIDNAHRLLSSPKARKAFDLSLEPKESYDTYKVGGRFGLGCLLARRLTEAGARFIEVTHGYYPFKYWDTHDNGHTRMKELKQMIDAPIAQLVLDLEERKLLDRTLIVVASEFSRDMMIEGVPGLAKTLMINSLAETMSLDFTRVQFTPDLMPTDITGTTLLNEDEHGKRHFTFSKGPVFTNILLADEINRTPPKTQAALLEAMQERQVTIGATTHTLPTPFLVLATQTQSSKKAPTHCRKPRSIALCSSSEWDTQTGKKRKKSCAGSRAQRK